jgi:hypothetical protein
MKTLTLLAGAMLLSIVSSQADTVFAADIQEGFGNETFGIATGGHNSAKLNADAVARCIEDGGHKLHILKSPVLTPRANNLNGPTVLMFGFNKPKTWAAIASGRTYAEAEKRAIAFLKVDRKCTKWYTAKRFEAKP